MRHASSRIQLLVLSGATLCAGSPVAQETQGSKRAGSRFERKAPASRPADGARAAAQAALVAGISWLRAHQEPDGHWSAAGFGSRCPKDDRCDGLGEERQDLFVTSLATLAFLGHGSTPKGGPHADVVRRGVAWLIAQQDKDGLFGSRSHPAFLHAHGPATLAVCEAYLLSVDESLEGPAQKAIDYVVKARNPGGGWSLQPGGGEDALSTSIWMFIALVSARDARLTVPPQEEVAKSFLAWLDERTDPATGCISRREAGAASRGQLKELGDAPPATEEALCAAGLLSRIFLGQTPRDPALAPAAKTLLERCRSPRDAMDPSFLYLGSFASFQMGGATWKEWIGALESAATSARREERHLAGSWDPSGTFGARGGRVYSTAMTVLALEVCSRQSWIVGK